MKHTTNSAIETNVKMTLTADLSEYKLGLHDWAEFSLKLKNS